MNLETLAVSAARSGNLSDLANQLRVSERELRGLLMRRGLSSELPALREELAPHLPVNDDLLLDQDAAALLDEAETLARKHPVRHQQHYQHQFPGDAPYLITFTGDWHIGEAGTDHVRLKEDAQLISELREGRHVLVAMGDYIGGYMASRTPSNNAQVLSPDKQRVAARGLLDLLSPDLILEGDHDCWHNRHDNELEWIQDYCRLTGTRYAQWGASLEITAGRMKTRVLARHRFDGSRAVNPYLPQVNLNLKHGPADIVALAHVHSNPGVSQQASKRETDGRFWAVQSGTYKTFDDYGKKLGVGNGEYGVPSLLVLPEEGLILPYPDLEEAVKTAKALQ
ncbi:hypothetical protein Dxin01_00165 [Deinococcus xinjiangensis]|uniref:Calcineurin-like phosphoesterase domain-containing protein n=1 Tax=Deinococcus xinjiangensis TaxID=457454 RepID=A0ABP9V5G1_9DEIO